MTGAILDFAKLRDIMESAPFVKGDKGDLVSEQNPQSLRDNSFAKEPMRPLLVIDGSQSFPHFAVDVVRENIDFFIATGHKVMADTGIGILYGKKHLLQMMEPALCGGGAINAVSTL